MTEAALISQVRVRREKGRADHLEIRDRDGASLLRIAVLVVWRESDDGLGDEWLLVLQPPRKSRRQVGTRS